MNRLNPVLYFYVLLMVLSSSACYSLKSTSIGPGVNTYFVDNFKMTALSAPANINLDFTTDLREKIEQQSRLRYDDQNPDIEYEGTISSYRVTSVAPTANNRTSFDRLTIGIDVKYIEPENIDNNWDQKFSFFRDFERDQNLVDIQDELIEDIFDQITEDIFNKSFTNW